MASVNYPTIEEVKKKQVGEKMQGFYLANKANIRQQANGSFYMTLELKDSTGLLDAKLWNIPDHIKDLKAGSIIKVGGTVGSYNEKPQLTIEQIRRPNDEDDVPTSRIIRTSQFSGDELIHRAGDYIKMIENEDLRTLVISIYGRFDKVALANHPAAKAVHHEFIGGLLDHTTTMAEAAVALHHIYPKANLSLVLSAILLHDIGKMQEFVLSDAGVVEDYSYQGDLLGHIYLGAELIHDAAKETGMSTEMETMLKHLVLSHHGKKEWGSPKTPMTIEAHFVSFIDLFDSRMMVYNDIYDGLEPGSKSEQLRYLSEPNDYSEKKLYRMSDDFYANPVATAEEDKKTA